MRQRIELTGTNRSSGLIAPMIHGRCHKGRRHGRKTKQTDELNNAQSPTADGLLPTATLAEQAVPAQDAVVDCRSPGPAVPEKNLSFAGPVTGARSPNPIPSRTRPLNSSAPMVLCLKTRESRSLPGLPRTDPHSIPSPRDATSAARAKRHAPRPLLKPNPPAGQRPHHHATAAMATPDAMAGSHPGSHHRNKNRRGVEQPGSSSGS